MAGSLVHQNNKGISNWVQYTQKRINVYNKNFLGFFSGQTGCIFEDTKLFNQKKTLGELYKEGNRFVKTYSLHLKRNMPIQSTSEIIDSGIKDVYEIELENGEKVIATDEHRFFKQTGHTFIASEVKDLKIGDMLRVIPPNKITEYFTKANNKQKVKTRTKFNPTKKCVRCGDLFDIKCDRGSNKQTHCKNCQPFTDMHPIDFKYWKRKNTWLPEEDNILIKYYYSSDRKFIASQLNNRTWIQIQKRTRWIGLKRDKKFMYAGIIKNTIENNPTKQKEVREKISKKNKEYLRQHPEQSLNNKLRRNHITSIEKKVRTWLINIFKLKPQDDFTFNQYMKVKGTYKFPDFTIHKNKLIIECDGLMWHNKEADDKRDVLLKERGYTVLHLTDHQINRKPLEAITCIHNALSQ